MIRPHELKQPHSPMLHLLVNDGVACRYADGRYLALVTGRTLMFERKNEWLNARWGLYTGHVRAWRSLINDVHSPMDAWPRHEAWDMVY